MCAKSAMQKDNPDRRLEVWGGSWVGAGTGGGWAERLTKWLSLSSGDSRPPLKQRLNIWKGEDDNPQCYLINSRFSLIKKAGGKKREVVSQPGLFHKQFSADNKFHSVENTEICQAFFF